MERIWQQHYVKGVPSSIRFESVTLPEALARNVSRYPQTKALVFEGTELTFAELEDAVSRFSAALRSLGVKPGDRVSIILPNLIQTAVAIYGALYAGAVAVMHNPRNDDMLMEYQLNDAGSQVVVALDVLVPRLMSIRKRTRVKRIIACHIRDYLPFVKKKLFALVKKDLHLDIPTAENVWEYTELLEGNKAGSPVHRSAMQDTAFVLYTSATTGKSKGVELTHSNLSWNVQQARSWFPTFQNGREVVVGCLPFFHVFGLTCALHIGIFYGFSDVLIPLPAPKAILDAIHTYRASFLPAIPVFYTGMINDPSLKKYDLTSLRGCFSGAAPLPLEIIRKFEELTGAQICEGYGLTECSPVTHINPLGGKCKPGTIGLPLPNTEAKIVDVDDYTVEISSYDVPGELCIKGPQVMRGYVNLPEQTSQNLRDGWVLTGDIVKMDEEGYFSVVDRKKDLIMSRGGRVYPRDVDEVLFGHPKILDACTLGIREAKGEETVMAFVVLKKGQQAGAQEIIDYCKKHLPLYQVPEKVELLPSLPRSLAGKVLRKELRRMHLVRTSRARPGKE